MSKINVEGSEISIIAIDNRDYISLTDMVRNIENGSALIEKWLRNKNTIEFLGIWEEMYNPNFNSPEFEGIKNEAGLNRFILSVKQWVEKTDSIGIVAKAGRYGGTYAHKDIAFEFASWVSPYFKLYLIKEFERLKEEEQKKLGWDIKRNLADIISVIRKTTDTPIVVGLDGHHPEELQKMKEMADGITTGSIVVDMINKNGKEAGAPIQEYVEKLKISIKG